MRKKILSPTLYPLDRDPSKKWFVQYYVGTPPVRQKARVPHLIDIEARLAAANSIITDLKKNPRAPKKKEIAYVDKIKLAVELLESRKSALEESSYGSYKSHFKILNEYCKKNNIRSLTPAVASEFLEFLLNSGKHPQTVNSYVTTFNVHFNKLKKKKLIRINPFEESEVIKCESECPYFYKTNQITQLKRYMLEQKPFLWAACRWIFYQFLRPNELRNLKISDIDFDDWKIKVKATTTKNSRSVWLPIMDGLRKELEPLCLYQYPQNYYVVGHDGLPSEEQLGKNYWRVHHRQMLEKFGYNTDNYKMYGWKHTGFVLAYKAGVGIVELKLLARHHSIEETYNYMRSIGLIDFPDVKAVFPII